MLIIGAFVLAWLLIKITDGNKSKEDSDLLKEPKMKIKEVVKREGLAKEKNNDKIMLVSVVVLFIFIVWIIQKI